MLAELLVTALEVIVGASGAILGVLVLFHLPSACRAKAHHAPPPSRSSVAIIIPFFNEPHPTLIAALQAIEAQHYRGRIDVVLIDDGSSNATSAHVQCWLESPRRWRYRLEILGSNGGRKGKALDVAMGLIDGAAEVVMVIDSDTMLAPSALQRAMNTLMQDERNAACCGYVIPLQDNANLLERLQYFEHTGFLVAVKHAQSKIGKVAVIAGAFSLHRLSAVRALGGWGGWLVEDVAWTWKALANGYRIVYAHDAIAHTVCPATFRQLFRQRRRWARGKVEAMAAAWSASRSQSVLLLPWTLLWLQISFCPSLLIIPALFLLPDSEVLAMAILLNIGLMLALYLLAHNPGPAAGKRALRSRVAQALTATACNLVFDLVNVPANLLGVLDGLFNRRKAWLTRRATDAPQGAGNSAISPNDADAST